MGVIVLVNNKKNEEYFLKEKKTFTQTKREKTKNGIQKPKEAKYNTTYTDPLECVRTNQTT